MTSKYFEKCSPIAATIPRNYQKNDELMINRSTGKRNRKEGEERSENCPSNNTSKKKRNHWTNGHQRHVKLLPSKAVHASLLLNRLESTSASTGSSWSTNPKRVLHLDHHWKRNPESVENVHQRRNVVSRTSQHASTVAPRAMDEQGPRQEQQKDPGALMPLPTGITSNHRHMRKNQPTKPSPCSMSTEISPTRSKLADHRNKQHPQEKAQPNHDLITNKGKLPRMEKKYSNIDDEEENEKNEDDTAAAPSRLGDDIRDDMIGMTTCARSLVELLDSAISKGKTGPLERGKIQSLLGLLNSITDTLSQSTVVRHASQPQSRA
jgi:hypothetical protein